MNLHRDIAKALTVGILAALALLALGAAPASAAPGRSLLRTLSVGPNTLPNGLATDSEGNLYTVAVEGQPRVTKLSPTGGPVPFSGSANYIAGNALTAPGGNSVPGGDSFVIQPGFGAFLAVDRSGGPTDGNIYVARSNDIDHDVATFVFDKTGTYLGTLGPHRTFGNYGVCGIAVNQSNGAVYVADAYQGTVTRYPAPSGDLAHAKPNGVLHANGCSVAVDDSGAVYGGYQVTKYPADQFDVASPSGTMIEAESARALGIDPVSQHLLVDRGNTLLERDTDGTLLGSPFGSLYYSLGIAGDGSGRVFATDYNGGIFVYGSSEVQLPLATTGEASEVGASTAKVEGSVDPDGTGGITGCEFRFGEDSGYSDGSAPCIPAASPGSPIASATPVTANLSGLVSGVTYHYRLFATNANGTTSGEDRTLTTPAAIENVATAPATEVTKESATLNGSFTNPGKDTHYYFEWGPTLNYGNNTPAPPGNDAGSTGGQQEVAPVAITGLEGETTYHFRLVAVDADGTARGQDESFTTDPSVTNLTADPPTGVTNTSAQLNGSFDADSHETHYYFEWGATTAYGNKTPVPPGNVVPAGSGRVSVAPVAISGLSEGSTYHYRIVATNSLGASYSEDFVLKAAEPPIVNNLSTRNVLATSAELAGEINPRWGDTTYYFEWGVSTAYGNKTPVESAGSGEGFVPVSVQLEGLASGVTYHFRLVAKNQYGEVTSPDQTFGFYPPACPNAQLRQETRSNSLPDCRAYELTTPSYAQGALIFPLGGPTSPYATNPSRIAYTVDLGTFPEESGSGDPANITGDLYVSTRTDSGWVQRFIGKPATEGFMMGAPPITGTENYTQAEIGPSKFQLGTLSDPALSRIVQWDRGWPGVFENRREPSNAPFVWDTTNGNLLERWPTNLEQVPGGKGFVGLPTASADLGHFVFSSNVVFAPGGEATPGELVCCSPPLPPLPGFSIYDNDVASGSVELASVRKDGTPFQGWLYSVSDDGSTIVMGEGSFQQKFFTGPIYVRIDGERTEEIAPGKQVRYVGATADDRTIYITSTDQLTAADTDDSEDLYRWQASDPNALTLVSIGTGGRGNSEACTAEWNGGGCGVEIIDFKKYAGFAGGEGGNGHSDNFIASESGDIYFESPEQLVAGKGETDEANLYLYRQGSLRFVATLEPKPLCTAEEFVEGCSTGPVARMQVTPDGAHMALITASHLTGYDSGAFGEMYTFDPEKNRTTCVSCRPDGKPPVWETLASQNGLFLTADGRAFFSTVDPLVPRDTNEAEDVYEYSEGKPWLISAGIGSSLKGIYGFVAFLSRPGLVSVSANGNDVYFATIDPLVSQDHNGAALKIYDARTGGGFPAERVPPNCAAADECHGAVSNPPALPPDRTSANLGQPKKHKAHKHKRKHRRHKRKHRKQGHQKTKKHSSKQGGKRRG